MADGGNSISINGGGEVGINNDECRNQYVSLLNQFTFLPTSLSETERAMVIACDYTGVLPQKFKRMSIKRRIPYLQKALAWKQANP